jgi:hypothetical protein
MKSVVRILAFSCLVAVGSWTLTGCGTSNATKDKMGMADRMGDEKMGGQKMGMDASSDKMMEPAKMGDGKMAGGKMDDEKMEKK